MRLNVGTVSVAILTEPFTTRSGYSLVQLNV